MKRAESLRLALIAGEASGDVLGADLARALREQRGDVQLAGITGPRMRAAGVTSWFDIEELSVMGLTEILRHLPRLVRLRKNLRQRLIEWPAHAVITIDAPDFNLGLARQLHQHGMTTIHYVSPSVWAWRPGRIPKIARSLDQLLTLFPFEPALYQPFGLDARFVGHPLADELSAGPDQANARENLQIRSKTPVIALLPGSRDSELRRHVGLLADTATVLRAKYPDGELMLLLTGERHRALAVDLAGPRLNQAGVRLRTGLTRTGLEAADVAVAASGTVTLEAFLLECPMVVFYKLAPTTFLLARSLKLVRSEFVALPNILSGQPLVPERLQHAAAPERLAADVMAWLSDQARLEDYCQRARQWRSQLARQAGHQAASAIVECMHGQLG